MKRWITLAGAVLALSASLLFVVHVVRSVSLQQLRDHVTAGTSLAMAAAVLLCALVSPIGAIAWQRILRSLGNAQPLLRLSGILLTTQAGKYLPGNVAHHLGRVGLAMSAGIPAPVVVASLAYEVPLILITSLLAGIAFALLSPRAMAMVGGLGDELLFTALVAAGLLAAVVLAAALVPRLVARTLKRRQLDALPTPAARDLGAIVGINAIAYVCSGLAVYVLGTALFEGQSMDFALLAAAFAIAWAVGFVTPGAPAGIGIRESLLLLMLSGELGDAQAAILVAALRVATTLGDMLCFGIGILILWHQRRAGAAAERDGGGHGT